MGKDIKSKTLFCSFILLFLLINPLFASQENGIHIKEIIYLTLSIFILLLIILEIIVVSNTLKDSSMIKSEIKYLISKKKNKPKQEKELEHQNVKISLSYKVSAVTVSLTIGVIILIALPLSIMMMNNQKETLAVGLQRRVTVLMDSITNGTKVYLPSENTLELNLLTNQSDTLIEAKNVTILSYHIDNENTNADTRINYVWASNDENILQKIDTPELIYGESRLTIPEVDDIIKKYIMLNFDAKAKVKKTSTQISELVNEYKSISELNNNESLEKKAELEILIRELKTKLGHELHDIASQNSGSYPPYDKTIIDKKIQNYLFYQPILYQIENEENFFKGIILVEVNTENLLQSVQIAKREIIITIISISAVVIIIGTIISLFLSFFIVNPIRYLQRHVAMIKNTANKAELFDKKVSIETNDELAVLSANINEMTESLAQAAIYESMLLGGKEVQRAFLPLDTIDGVNKIKLSVGHIETENVQFFGYYEGAKGVSGDFFDFKKLDEKYFALIKCDVSGKGAPAALIMAEVSALFCDYFRNWSFEKDGINLQNLVYKINDHLEARNLKGKFAAFTLGIFDTISGDIYFCNAGDNIIHIYDSIAKELKTVTLPSTPAVGIFPSYIIEDKGGYPTIKIHLKKDDVLFLYTDGIEESKRFFRNDEGEIVKYIPNTDKIIKDNNDNNGIDGEEFGKERIKDIIEAVFTKRKYIYLQKENPIKNDDMNVIFDFSYIEGTPEDAIMALISIEKIFRIYITPSAKSYDHAVVDKKIDKFLQLYFNKYDYVCANKIEHPNPDLKNEYVYYTSIKEEEQTDDLTLVAIKKK